jgi:hypothetical protein
VLTDANKRQKNLGDRNLNLTLTVGSLFPAHALKSQRTQQNF